MVNRSDLKERKVNKDQVKDRDGRKFFIRNRPAHARNEKQTDNRGAKARNFEQTAKLKYF